MTRFLANDEWRLKLRKTIAENKWHKQFYCASAPLSGNDVHLELLLMNVLKSDELEPTEFLSAPKKIQSLTLSNRLSVSNWIKSQKSLLWGHGSSIYRPCPVVRTDNLKSNSNTSLNLSYINYLDISEYLVRYRDCCGLLLTDSLKLRVE